MHMHKWGRYFRTILGKHLCFVLVGEGSLMWKLDQGRFKSLNYSETLKKFGKEYFNRGIFFNKLILMFL